MHRLPAWLPRSAAGLVRARGAAAALALLLVLSSCTGRMPVSSAAGAILATPAVALAGSSTPEASVGQAASAPSAPTVVGGAAPASPAGTASVPAASPTAGPTSGPAGGPSSSGATAPAAGPSSSTAGSADREEVVQTPVLPTPSISSAQAPGAPPSAPQLALRPNSDTGVSDSDLLTGNNMPVFEGYAPISTTVAVYDSSVLLGTAPVEPTGYWSYMVDVDAAFNDGLHHVTAVAIDKAGRKSPASTVLNLTINTQPPDMPAITAATAQSRGAGSSLTLSGTAPLSTTVTVMEERAPLASARVDASGAWSVTFNDVTPGRHDYRASATNTAGVTSPAYNTRSVTVTLQSAAGGGAAAVMTSPLATPTASSPYTGTVVAAAAGDIACGTGSSGYCQQTATANLLLNLQPDIVLPLGDNQYECGSLSDFKQHYAPTWGHLLGKTHPTPGNHEYESSRTPGDPCYKARAGAPGYFQYFGNAASPDQPGCTVDCRGYYSFDAGAWHIVVLNSICGEVGGCGLGSPQETWLKNDLASHPTACTLAYWHYPRFSSGTSGKTFLNGLKAFWQDLYNAGVEIVLNGHDHDYERFSRLDVSGNLDTAHGIREFVVGTGGRDHQDFTVTAPWSQVRNNTTFGVLALRLSPGRYSWQFLPVAGQTVGDSGSEACRTW